MKFALMQPYFMPYLGYWQLINEVDVFVISDDTKYIKQSWINRNRVWKNSRVDYLTIPISAGSDSLKINQREISESFSPETFIRQNLQDYKKSKNTDAQSLIKNILNLQDRNLSRFLLNSINETLSYLEIKKQIMVASELGVPDAAKGQERIFYLADKLGIYNYVNLPGGKNLYSKDEFERQGLELDFISPTLTAYENTIGDYVPGLSLIDLLFNVEKSKIKDIHIPDYILD